MINLGKLTILILKNYSYAGIPKSIWDEFCAYYLFAFGLGRGTSI